MSNRQPSLSFPVWGVIGAGQLRGWRFSFLQFVAVQQGSQMRIYLDLRCTPPNWPFPQDVRFDPDHDELVLLPGPRARHLSYEQLVGAALKYGVARVPFEDR